MLRQSRGLLLLVGALALLTLLHWATALGGGAHANAQMGSGLLQHLDAMRQTNRRLTAELDSSRAAQAAARAAAQTTERVLREENVQLKADRDAALTKAAQNALRARAAVEASAASRLPAVQATTPPVATASSLQASDFSGRFLVASVEEAPEGGHSPEYLRVLLRSLLGMAVLLKRQLVLPAALCDCRDRGLTQCEGEAVAPFGCPLTRGLALPTSLWQRHPYLLAHNVTLRSASLLHDSSAASERVRTSHMRVLLPDGMDDSELLHALTPYDGDVVLEVQRAHRAFCGWDARAPPGNAAKLAAFDAAADELLTLLPGHTPNPPPRLGACTHYRGGTGEVLQFTNVGQAGTKHAVTASRDKLPHAVRSLPAGTDLMVTFATGSVWEMATNWVRNAQRAGVAEVLIGALDQQMIDMCDTHGVPCVLVDGGSVTKALANRSAANVREDATLYPKMSVLKVGFYHELLSFGFNVWACDADAIFLSDPRPLMRQGAWAHADVAVATDCIDLPSDARSPLLHCDFNTGLVFLRSSAAGLAFTERWKETVASAREKRIRDQAAFNMLTKQPGKPLQPYLFSNGTRAERVYTTEPLPGVSLKLLVLPLDRFLNGHTYFVQHAHTLPQAKPAVSVHMTYQFGEGSRYAYGKRQRLREAGLWHVDPDSYYAGRYVSASARGLNLLPVRQLNASVDSREAVAVHLAEARHRARMLRALLGVAKVTGRAIILPRLLCYCDFMWKEMRACRVGGAETMRLPFECPMDHALDTPVWFENTLGIEVREPNFLSSPRVPAAVLGSRAAVTLPKGLDDTELAAALAPHRDVAILEIDDVADR